MKRLKKISVLVGTIFAIGTVGTIIEACNNNEADISTEQGKNEKFMADVTKDLNQFLVTPIIAPTSRSAVYDDLGPKTPGYTTVFIDFIDGDDETRPIPISEITTPDELLVLVKDYGASFSFEDDGSGDSTIVISDEEANNSLTDLILKSKQYLYGIGFTEADIQEMLVENNATEAELVPFVIALVEEEKNGNLYSQNQTWNPFSLLSTPAQAANITWKDAGNCALTVIGLDIFAEMANSGAKKITVALAKKAFGNVAKRLLGPVGVVIALVEFSACLFDF